MMTQATIRVIKELFTARFDESRIIPLSKGRITKRQPLSDDTASHLVSFSKYLDSVLRSIYVDLGLFPSPKERQLVLESIKEAILDALRVAKNGVGEPASHV